MSMQPASSIMRDRLEPTPFYRILHAMILHDDSEAEFTRSEKSLQWLCRHTESVYRVFSDTEWDTLSAAWVHYSRFKAAPSRRALEVLIREQDKHSLVLDELRKYDQCASKLGTISHTDLDLQLHIRREDCRKYQLSEQLKTAMNIVLGSIAGLKKGDPPLSGVDDAKQYIRKALLQDIGAEKPALQGDWAENADYIEKALLDSLSPQKRQRIYTGFRHIDEATTIGASESIRYIGILGFTNHGKSGFLNSLLYNMARAGSRILLVPRECSVEETWQRFTFMHADYFRSLLYPRSVSGKSAPTR